MANIDGNSTTPPTYAPNDENGGADGNIFTYDAPASWDSNPDDYQWELQRIYNYGALGNNTDNYGNESYESPNLNKPLTDTEAADAIDSLGIDFGGYTDTLKQSITGLTAVEAHLYLRDVLGQLDKADGTEDKKINYNGKTADEFITSAFANAEFSDNPAATEDDIKTRLTNAAAEYKENDDPTDETNISLIKASASGNYDPDNLNADQVAAAQQIEDSAEILGISNNNSVSQDGADVDTDSDGDNIPDSINKLFDDNGIAKEDQAYLYQQYKEYALKIQDRSQDGEITNQELYDIINNGQEYISGFNDEIKQAKAFIEDPNNQSILLAFSKLGIDQNDVSVLYQAFKDAGYDNTEIVNYINKNLSRLQPIVQDIYTGFTPDTDYFTTNTDV